MSSFVIGGGESTRNSITSHLQPRTHIHEQGIIYTLTRKKSNTLGGQGTTELKKLIQTPYVCFAYDKEFNRLSASSQAPCVVSSRCLWSPPQSIYSIAAAHYVQLLLEVSFDFDRRLPERCLYCC